MFGLLQLDPDPTFWALVQQFLTMGGFAALVAILINVFKAFGWVKDGTAGTWSAVANLIGVVGLFVVQNFFPEANVSLIDEHLGAIAQILTGIFNYVFQYWVSSGTHKVLSAGNVPLIGTSNTPKGIVLESYLDETVSE